MVAKTSDLTKKSDDTYHYCKVMEVWFPRQSRFIDLGEKGTTKLPISKWEKKTAKQLAVMVKYGHFLRLNKETD